MKKMVKIFFDKHVPLMNKLVSHELDPDFENSELKEYLKQLENEWHSIPLVEKQIPYLDIEKPFWHVYWMLHILYVSKQPKEKKDIIFSKFNETKQSYLRREIPENCDAKRPPPW